MDLNFDFTEKRVILTVFFCMAFTIANLITVKIININFLGMETPAGVFVFMTTLILFLPSPDFFTGDAALSFVFTQTPRILIASYISYLIGNLVNARLTTIVNEGKAYASGINLLVLAFSEFIDNFVFIGLAFVGVYSVVDILIMIITHWILSLIWTAIAQPFTTMTVRWAEKGKPAEA